MGPSAGQQGWARRISRGFLRGFIGISSGPAIGLFFSRESSRIRSGEDKKKIRRIRG